MKKLKLRREAVRVLTHLALGHAQGGVNLSMPIIVCMTGPVCPPIPTATPICVPLTRAC